MKKIKKIINKINESWDKLTLWAKNLPNKVVARFATSVMACFYISYIPGIYNTTNDLINSFSELIDNQYKLIFKFVELYKWLLTNRHSIDEIINYAVNEISPLWLLISEMQFMYYMFTLIISTILVKIVWPFFYWKLFFSLLLLIAVRAGLPRFRYDGLPKISWNSYIPHIIILIILLMLGGGGGLL